MARLCVDRVMGLADDARADPSHVPDPDGSDTRLRKAQSLLEPAMKPIDRDEGRVVAGGAFSMTLEFACSCVHGDEGVARIMPPKRKAPEGQDSSSSIVVDEFSKLLKEQAKVHGEQILQLLQMQNAGQGREREQVRPEPSSEGAYERFRKMKPPEFEGSTDPMVALEWVKAVEAIYDYLQFDDKDRVSFAIFLLTKTARIWWDATKISINVSALKWQEFKDLFYDKYFPRDVRSQKVKEFLELRQGNMTIQEYILKFEEGFSLPHIWPVMTLKRDEKEIEKERQLKRQDFSTNGQGSRWKGKGKFRGKEKEEYRPKAPMPPPAYDRHVCPKCGKMHTGECLVGSNRCFRCGGVGHVIKNCPVKGEKGNDRVQGRIFAMTKEGANPDSSVISTFDVILGMDWLSSYHAVIDCVAKTVRFPSKDDDSGIFQSSGTAPISKAPYRMAPTEMKELKNQLHDLLDKGFIRPNSSPWGAPLLREKKLYAKLKKCEFWLEQVSFLGHIVSNDGVVVDPMKIEAIKQWPIPTTVSEKELNMRHRRWLELVKDYDVTISYHPGKANVIADALSRKSVSSLSSLIQKPLLLDLQRSEVAMVEQGTIARLSTLVIRPTLTDRIRQEQPNDNQLMELRSKADKKGNREFAMNTDDLLTWRGRICVPSGNAIRRDVLTEVHIASYSIHPGSTKMYQDLRRLYWWRGMKSDITKFIS
ncbi:uncharacterized protein LOC142554593 [Primulina tabacum]|uniref:uncharacterized protein LOC142554593 n=1 Tax=Primulina tabacum TaxID=48773 RepID=UPI003F591809